MTGELAKTLSEKQQRKSLSSSKGGKRSIRNVLAKPYSGFWPLADSYAESELQELLEQLLPAARKPETTEDHVQLRNMQGKRMKEARQILRRKIWEREPKAKMHRENAIIGVNDVSRALEDNLVASLLVSNEADPPILTRHLATLAAGRNVPFVVLQNLKHYTKNGLNFSSLTIGFKKIVAEEEENHFHPLHLKIVSIFKSIAEKVVPCDLQDEIVAAEVPSSSIVTDPKVKFRCPNDIHLIRSSKRSRVFVPGGRKEDRNDSSSQFISFSSSGGDQISCSSLTLKPETSRSKSVLGAKLFIQTVRSPQTPVECVSETENLEAQMEMKIESQSGSKRIKRYFSPLVPLKVKKIQGNPNKLKKKKEVKRS